MFAELAAGEPRRRFTVGIQDDVTGLSLPLDDLQDVEADDVSTAVFYGLGADGTVSSNKAAIRIIGDTTDLWCQGHFVYDSKKSGSTTVSHLRFGPRPIRSTYEIQRAGFVAVHDPEALDRRDVLDDGVATILLNSPVPADELWDPPAATAAQQVIVDRGCRLWTIDAARVAEANGLGRRVNTIMSTCFFALAGVLPGRRRSPGRPPRPPGASGARRWCVATWRPSMPRSTSCTRCPSGWSVPPRACPAVPEGAPDFVQRVTRLMLEGRGDLLPVSAFPPDGTWPTGTSRFEKRSIAADIPIWEPDLCIQCNRCSMICPHAAIRTKAFEPAAIEGDPAGLTPIPEAHTADLAGRSFLVQVSPDDCTGCTPASRSARRRTDPSPSARP
ncbi:MAG: 2-oxoacid:acceptor oxidoreductase family protein [Acidimicrobiales bacterium]